MKLKSLHRASYYKPMRTNQQLCVRFTEHELAVIDYLTPLTGHNSRSDFVRRQLFTWLCLTYRTQIEHFCHPDQVAKQTASRNREKKRTKEKEPKKEAKK